MSPDYEEEDGLYDDNPDGYDRNGVLGSDGQVYSDADPGL